MAKQFGDAVKITRDPGTLSQLDAGGRAIYGGGIRCSLGFNVRRGDTYYFLTAGHCTNASYNWSGQWGYLGYREHSYFPGRDHGIVRYNSNASRTGHVYLYNGSYQDIARAGNAYVGQRIQRSGSSGGTTFFEPVTRSLSHYGVNVY